MVMLHRENCAGQAARMSPPAPRNSAPMDTHRGRRRLPRALAGLAALYLLCDWFGKARIVTREYEISDARIQSEVRIALVSDLHNSLWGAGQSDLLAAIAETRPDAVVLDGDLFDMHGDFTHTETLLSALSATYPCYFVFGNHEYRTGRAAEIRELLGSLGISALSGDLAMIMVGKTSVQLFGVDDGRGGMAKLRLQLKHVASRRDESLYSILAIHCPDEVERYLAYGFDLMLSGHTHGGQIRIPGLLNGLYAPGQGLFPKYGGGRYDFDDQTLIISRGLSKRPYWLPRVFNPPELVLVRLLPEG